jgi:hypothetical protein
MHSKYTGCSAVQETCRRPIHNPNNAISCSDKVRPPEGARSSALMSIPLSAVTAAICENVMSALCLAFPQAMLWHRLWKGKLLVFL